MGVAAGEAVAAFAGDGLTLLSGHCVVELRPVEASKARAVAALVARFPEHRPIYVGDDATDEEAIAALPAGGIGVRVGPEEAPSGASRRVPDVAAVLALLRARAGR